MTRTSDNPAVVVRRISNANTGLVIDLLVICYQMLRQSPAASSEVKSLTALAAMGHKAKRATIYGGEGNNVLWGGSGNDAIWAGAGHDRMGVDRTWGRRR